MNLKCKVKTSDILFHSYWKNILFLSESFSINTILTRYDEKGITIILAMMKIKNVYIMIHTQK